MVAGTGLNAYGQYQGLKGQQGALDQQMGAQRGFDRQLRERTDALIKEIYPDAIDGKPVAEAMRTKLDTVSGNLANAVAAAGNRRTRGSQAAPESRAVTAQNQHAVLARALQDNQVQAAMQALAGSGRKLDILGREYSGDAGNIRGDAQRWYGILPLQQAAGGYQGQWARQLGSLFSMGGQGLMMAGMAAPGAAGAGAGAATAAEAPVGGWAADTTYAMPGGGQGAWS